MGKQSKKEDDTKGDVKDLSGGAKAEADFEFEDDDSSSFDMLKIDDDEDEDSDLDLKKDEVKETGAREADLSEMKNGEKDDLLNELNNVLDDSDDDDLF